MDGSRSGRLGGCSYLLGKVHAGCCRLINEAEHDGADVGDDNDATKDDDDKKKKERWHAKLK